MKRKSAVSKTTPIPTLPTPLQPDIKPGKNWFECVANISQAFGKSEAQVTAALVWSGLEKVVAHYNAERSLKSLKAVLCITDMDGKVSALGFLKGKLVYCDGKKVKALTLKESIPCYMKIYRGWMNHEGNHDTDEDAFLRWLGMIAKAL